VTELPRLLEAADEFERELILSARRDEPSPRALGRTLVSLGVGLGAVPVGIASAGPSATAGGKLGGVVLAKWLFAGVALGTASVGGVQLLNAVHEPPAAVMTQRRAGASAAAPPRTLRPAARAEQTLVPAPELPRAPDLPAAPGFVPRPPRAEGSAAAQPLRAAPSVAPAERAFEVDVTEAAPAALERETRLVDAARRALARGDAAGALATLSGYERAFSNGALRPEASVLKVRALLGVGDREGAESLGRRIIAEAPQSEHAGAIRAVLGARTNP
jgi:hypothetical protein